MLNDFGSSDIDQKARSFCKVLTLYAQRLDEEAFFKYACPCLSSSYFFKIPMKYP